MLRVAEPDLGARERELIYDVLRTNTISQGEYQELFEEYFAKHQQVAQACACSSGTAALHLALMALSLSPGEEVIVPDLTFVATANAVRYCNATPVFCDVTTNEWTLNPADVQAVITSRTVGIIAVHLYGVPARMQELRRIANTHGLWLIEDAPQALGATIDERPIGAFGDMATFGFTGNKVLTTGEGGMVTTDDSVLASRVRHLRGQAQCPEIHRYWHDTVGCNYRLSNLACAIGCAQLEKVQTQTNIRRMLDARYRASLSERVQFQMWPVNTRPSAWMTTIRFRSQHMRDDAERRLADLDIETRQPFVPLSRLPMFGSGEGRQVAREIAETGLTLPTHQGVSEWHVDRIVGAVRDAVQFSAVFEGLQ